MNEHARVIDIDRISAVLGNVLAVEIETEAIKKCFAHKLVELFRSEGEAKEDFVKVEFCLKKNLF